MDYLQLGNTSVNISRIGLGTMNFGEQNTETEAHEQLDYAISCGINFIDTAEMYPVPADPKTSGNTEIHVGNWISSRKNRDKFFLATKACGPGLYHIRKSPKFNKEHLTEALNNSLSRLKTDYIDLYQLHWPERKTNYFGRLGYVHNENDPWKDNFLEILEIISGFVKEGKIRFLGLSNETPWGVLRFLHLAEVNNLPRIVSIQNPYNLINRTFEIGLSEICHREKVSLLAYSPLAFGRLTGKYYGGAKPEKSRLTLFGDRLPRYNNEFARKASDIYTDLANEYKISPVQLALAFVNSRSFLTTNIIGATTMEQLKENIDSLQIVLNKEILDRIEKIHTSIPNPAP